MKLTRKVHVALEALLLVAQRQGSSPLNLNIISRELSVSVSYLEGLFQSLRLAQMVTPVRGPGGGYRLALNAQDIAVSQVAAAVEPNQTEDLEPSDKSGQASPVEDMTLGLAARVHEVEQLFLDQVSLADVLKSYKERQQRTVRLHRPSLHSEAYRYSDSRLGEETAIHP